MITNANDFIKKVKKEGTLLRHDLAAASEGAKHFRCSIYLKSRNLLIKGECNYPMLSDKTPFLVFFEPDTCTVKGESGCPVSEA